MITLSYKFGGRKYEISREAVVSAMRKFDKTSRSSRRGTKYFVWWHRRSYPPKDLLRLLPKRVEGSFSGGNTTNQVFRDLEFYVGKGHHDPKRLPRSNIPIPSISTLKKRLLAERWAPLVRNFLSGQAGKYPGVYMFAWSDRKLKGKRIALDDVFYVGSSCTALNTRLNQFYKGTKENCCHSAAMRFYRRWRRRSRPGQSFFAATVHVPCETRKELRTAKDIQKMGRVAELEYAMLGEIKRRTGFEPLLNRK